MEQPAIIIQDDNGGRVGDYINRYAQIKRDKTPVIFDGRCSSACTLGLGLPSDQICATAKASFGFHSPHGPLEGKFWIDVMMSYYPEKVKVWINKRGGLDDNMKFLSGAKLREIINPC